MATAQQQGKAQRPWDLEAVQNLISTLNISPEVENDIVSSANGISVQNFSSGHTSRAIGDLTPVFNLLSNHSSDSPLFRELEPLPLPTWPSKYTAAAPSKDTYVSDGAAMYRSPEKKPKHRTIPKIIETSDEDNVPLSTVRFKNSSEGKYRGSGKWKKTQKSSQVTRQTVSDGETSKPARQVTLKTKPATKAATHTATPTKIKHVVIQSPPATPSAKLLTPSHPMTTRSKALARTSSSEIVNLLSQSPQNKPRSKSDPSTVDSWLQRDKVHRDLVFRIKLIDSFPEDRTTLSQTVPFRDHPPSAGLHVFIDFSNIWVGFMNHIRGILGSTSLSFQHRQLSFESLVFLLERGRPVGRSVLGGSLPWLQAFDTAQRIGYECNILEKVLKDRPTLQGPDSRHRLSGGYSSSLPKSSSPFSNNSQRQYGPTVAEPEIMVPASVLPSLPSNPPPSSSTPVPPSGKWVEQGVDEILQMKMLESLLDTRHPSTMVLATGDGAKAEYSDGFTKVLERALLLGWQIELVSWAGSLNPIYKKFIRRWSAQFRFIGLEEFGEYLLEPLSSGS